MIESKTEGLLTVVDPKDVVLEMNLFDSNLKSLLFLINTSYFMYYIIFLKNIVEGKEWILVSGKKYTLNLIPKDANGEKLDYTEGYEYEILGKDQNNHNFKVVSIDHKKGVAIIEALNTGKCEIQAKIIKNNVFFSPFLIF